RPDSRVILSGVPRKVRAPQGKVPGNAWAARADGKCNRKIPPNDPVTPLPLLAEATLFRTASVAGQVSSGDGKGVAGCVVRVKWCGKSAPRVWQQTGTANPTWSKTK